jgi:hypothetical protein
MPETEQQLEYSFSDVLQFYELFSTAVKYMDNY